MLSRQFRESIDWHLGLGHRLIKLKKADGSQGDPKAPVRKGWRDRPGLTLEQAYAAVEDGHNIGWAPTGEHLIIDVDMHGKDGLATYRRLRKILPATDTIPRVDSSRGGFHLYFRKPADVPVSSVALRHEYGEGVDIIANTQVVIPASMHPVTGEPYKFTNMPDEIPWWSPELEALVTYRPEENTREAEVAIEYVERAVDAIPNDFEYDDWLGVGAAIHHSTGGSEEGRQLFHEWSATNDAYDEAYTDKKWRSFGRYGGRNRGFGSLINTVRETDPKAARAIMSDRLADGALDPEDDFEGLERIDENGDGEPKKRRASWALTYEELSPESIKPDEWFYTDVLPRGAYAVMAGQQGLGKSTLIMRLAACVTTGAPFPGDERNPVKRTPGDVIYFSVEERVDQSIAPKLRQAGADFSRMHVVKAGLTRETRNGVEVRGFSVTDGMSHLEDAMTQFPDTKLVIFDPITMFILHDRDNDTYNATSMNQTLAPLNRFAEKYDCCVLGVTHFNKSGAGGLDKVTGSIAHTTVARHVTYLLPHYIEHHTILATAKSNMFNRKTSYVFQGVELEPEAIPGYETPLYLRDLHLVEKVEERDAFVWEAIVKEQINETERLSPIVNLIANIAAHIEHESLQRRIWRPPEFKEYFARALNAHPRSMEQAFEQLKAEGQIHHENVRGVWSCWFIDGLLTTEDEIEAFNQSMREQVEAPDKLHPEQIAEFVDRVFPALVSYEEVHDAFDSEYSERQVKHAIREAVKLGLVERVHKHRAYYLGGL
jgi:energy-coupling factor transporter ATP-binding protein EcfA2